MTVLTPAAPLGTLGGDQVMNSATGDDTAAAGYATFRAVSVDVGSREGRA